MSTIRRFEEIEAWQLGRELTRRVYEHTRKGAFARDFGLSDQVRRASVSITSNIAEGFERHSRAEFARYLLIARGSAADVRSQLYAALDLGYLDEATFSELYTLAERISKATGALARHLRHSHHVGEPPSAYFDDSASPTAPGTLYPEP